MLALYPQMATHSHTPFSTVRSDLLRQPSAEDLDAAHQLVSSARGERTGITNPQDPQPSSTTSQQSVPPVSGPAESIEQAQPSDETPQLGQVCR